MLLKTFVMGGHLTHTLWYVNYHVSDDKCACTQQVHNVHAHVERMWASMIRMLQTPTLFIELLRTVYT